MNYHISKIIAGVDVQSHLEFSQEITNSDFVAVQYTIFLLNSFRLTLFLGVQFYDSFYYNFTLQTICDMFSLVCRQGFYSSGQSYLVGHNFDHTADSADFRISCSHFKTFVVFATFGYPVYDLLIKICRLFGFSI